LLDAHALRVNFILVHGRESRNALEYLIDIFLSLATQYYSSLKVARQSATFPMPCNEVKLADISSRGLFLEKDGASLDGCEFWFGYGGNGVFVILRCEAGRGVILWGL